MNISPSIFNSSLPFSPPNAASSPKPPPLCKAKQLRLLVINFQSIWGKKEELESILLEHDIDIVIGSESHLDPHINDSEILPPTYVAYRRDRGDGWGGVIIIAKATLITELVHSSKSAEFIAIKVESYQKPVIIAACYRPPRNTAAQSEALCSEIRKLAKKHKNKPIWIGGDTNLPDIDWSSRSIASHQYSKALMKISSNCLRNVISTN